MPLDDLKQAIERLPIGDALRATIESELPSSLPDALRVLVVGEGTRAEVLAQQLSSAAEWSSLDGSAVPPAGADAWVLALSADQLGSLREREFVHSIGGLSETNLGVYIAGIEHVPEARRDDLRRHAERLLGNVPRSHIVENVSDLNALLAAWTFQAGKMRQAVIDVWATRCGHSVRTGIDQTRAILATLPDLGRVLDDNRRWELMVTTAMGSLETGHVQILSNQDLATPWKSFVEGLEAKAPAGIEQHRFEDELTAWLEGPLAAVLRQRLEQYLTEKLRGLPAFQMEAEALHVRWSKHLPDDGKKPPPLWIRAGAPTIVGLVGFVLQGPWVAMVAAGLGGLLVSTVRILDPGAYAYLRSEPVLDELTSSVSASLASLLQASSRDLDVLITRERSERAHALATAQARSSERVSVTARLIILEDIAAAIGSL